MILKFQINKRLLILFNNVQILFVFIRVFFDADSESEVSFFFGRLKFSSY